MKKLFRFGKLEVIPIPLAKGVVVLSKGTWADLSDAEYMPERGRIIAPFLTAVITCHGVKEVIYT